MFCGIGIGLTGARTGLLGVETQDGGCVVSVKMSKGSMKAGGWALGKYGGQWRMGLAKIRVDGRSMSGEDDGGRAKDDG